jgi:hypothetical protein
MSGRRVVLNERDIRGLKWLSEQGAATIEQLWRAVWKLQDSDSSNYAYRRTRNLFDAGFVKVVKSPTSGKTFYAITGKARATVRSIELPVLTPRLEELSHTESRRCMD